MPLILGLSVFHIFMSAFHTICNMFPQIVEEYTRVVENLKLVQVWKPCSKYGLFMSAIFIVQRSLFMAMIW